MRLYLLPVSTRRTLLYAQRLHVVTTTKDANYADRGAAWAAKKWTEWEKRESGWQKKVVEYGNHAFRRIPYEEWGLKSVPPLSARRRDDELKGQDTVELVFPSKVIPLHKAENVARTLATERQALHRQRLIWSFVGMPISAPFALVPVIPNLPFFYLVYRAWSHWRALAGGKHVEWLSQNKLLVPSPSETLNELYSTDGALVEEEHGKEQMLLTQEQVRNFTKTLDIPALEIEMERAVWQVETALQKDAETKDAQKAEAQQEPPKDETAKEDVKSDKKE